MNKQKEIYDENLLRNNCDKLITLISSRLYENNVPVLQFSKVTGFSQPYLSKLFSHQYQAEKISIGNILKLLNGVGLTLKVEYTDGKILGHKLDKLD